MSSILPKEIERFLDSRYSHLVSRVDDPTLPDRIKQFLQERGTTINQQSTFSDDADVDWAVFSFRGESARTLVLELLENGFPESIRGIDAQVSQRKPSAGEAS